MNLLVLAGLVTPPTREQIGTAGMAALVLAAELRLRAGFQPDAAFIAGCCDYELEALAQANDRLAADRAALHGAASQGLQQAAMAAAARDGGASMRAVQEAQDLANADAEARRLLDRAMGESSLVQARPVQEIVFDEVIR